MTTWTARLDTDFKESLTVKDSADAVFNLTGHTVSAEVREVLNGTLKATTTVTVTSAAAGELDVELTDTQVNTLGKGDFFIDLSVKRNSDAYRFRSETVNLKVVGRVTA